MFFDQETSGYNGPVQVYSCPPPIPNAPAAQNPPGDTTVIQGSSVTTTNITGTIGFGGD